MIEITKLEAAYIRSHCPGTAIYRSCHSDYWMSEEAVALKALETFRMLSIKDQKYLVKGRA